jgi:(4S)-4-hydroxy-5-phosphonooxypentane-2,3-dione isomerase
MPRLAIIGAIDVAPAKRDRVLSFLMAHRSRCLKDEPGTLQFEVMTPHDDDAKILIYEVYRDAAAFELHRSQPSIAQFRKDTAGMIDNISVTRCALADEAAAIS